MKTSQSRALSGLFVVFASCVGLVAACSGASTSASDESTSTWVDDAGPIGAAGDSGSGTTGLPCDVANVLSSKCASCHGGTPAGGAPYSLVSYEDLTRASPKDPAQTVAQRCVARMKDSAAPMPPGAPASAGDVAPLEAWIAAGMPKGECGSSGGGDAGPNPFDVPPKCTSGAKWTSGDRGSKLMHPGKACITCHETEPSEAPQYAIAGTVYPSAHEPDDCISKVASGTAVVEITAEDGKVLKLPVNGSGNFFYEGPVKPPYKAKVTFEGRERVMATPQTDGDCNRCHTQSGTDGAPGRILLP